MNHWLPEPEDNGAKPATTPVQTGNALALLMLNIVNARLRASLENDPAKVLENMRRVPVKERWNAEDILNREA